MKLYLEIINGYEVYYADGDWIVEDENGCMTPYDTFEDAKEACMED